MEITMTGLYGKNDYTELRDRQQAEFNAFPIGFAFCDEQFAEMMSKWGLTTSKEDLKKIVSIGFNGFVRKSDLDEYHKMLKRHAEEMEAFKSNEEYWYHAFKTEMYNHEYGYTCDIEDTLDALGLTADEVVNNPMLNRAMSKAHNEVMKETEDW